MVGMLLGFCAEVYLWQFTHVPWTWWVAVGTTVTFATGYLGSRLFPGIEKIKSI
jgi:hypothetical protein